MKRIKGISILLAVMTIISSCFSLPQLWRLPSAYAAGTDSYEHDYYVAPDGDDGNDGSIGHPFATLERARDAIRELKHQSALTGSAVVYLREGTYFRNASFQLEVQDSGLSPSAPIVYRAYGNESVKLMGGYELNGGLFQPVSDPHIGARLPEPARDKVLQIDLRQLNITEYGQLEQIGRGEKDPYLYGDDNSVAPELFINGEAMNLARWPNDGYVTTGNVLDQGTITSRYWSNIKPDNPNYVPPEERDNPYRGALFQYTDNRPERWTKAKDIWMFGYWKFDWADATTRIETIDPANQTIRTDHALAYGVSAGKRYYYFNLLEEIDMPGEWYLDRETGVLYLYPPAPVLNSDVRLSVLQQPMVKLNNVSNVTFQGLTMEIMRGEAVDMNGGANNLVAGCTFRFIGEQAVVVKGGANHGIVSNDIYATGTGGITLNGGDRTTLTPGGHYAVNNTIQNYARVKKTYSPAVGLGGVGNKASHNLIHDAPHMAITYSGNDHVIENNEVYDVLMSTDDAGGVYSDRSWTSRGNLIRSNFFHHTGNGLGTHGNHTVYFDDGFSGVTLTENVFYKVADALFNHGGRDHKVENNIVIDSGESFIMSTIHPALLQSNMIALKNDLNKFPYQNELWSGKYPELVNILNDEPELPKGNRIEANVYINTPAERVQDVVRSTGTIRNNLSLAQDADPGFTDPESLNFQLKPDSIIYSQLPQFRPIPFGNIGLVTDDYRTSLPQLGPFQLVSPERGAQEVRPDGALLSWQPSRNADQYRLVVAADPDFTVIVKDQIVRGTSASISGLQMNQSYYWKVQAQSKSRQIREFVWNQSGPASFLANGSDPVTGVQLHEGIDYVAAGSRLKLFAAVEPQTANPSLLAWSSNRPELATVDSDGIVTGLSPGEVEITAASIRNPEIKDTVTLTVVPEAFLLAEEDFEDGKAEQWKVTAGTAAVVQDPDGNHRYMLDGSQNKEVLIETGNTLWQNYMAELSVTGSGSDQAASRFDIRIRHNRDTGSMYAFSYLPERNGWVLQKTVNGATSELGTASMAMQTGKEYIVRAEANGPVLRLYVNGVNLMEIVDRTEVLSGGGIGLYVWNGKYAIDQIQAAAIPKDVLFYDDFEDGNADGWSGSDSYAKVVKDSSGNYVYRLERLQNSEILSTIGDADWQDYSIEGTVRHNKNTSSNFSIRARFTDSKNNYIFMYRPYQSKWLLQKVVNGTYTVLAQYPMSIPIGKDVRVRADVYGSVLSLFADGVKLFEYTDPNPLSAGKAGLYVYNGGYDFDNVKVTANAEPPDHTPPVTTARVEGTPGNNGWYVSPVTITLDAADDRSGVALTEQKLSVVQTTYGAGTAMNEVYLPYAGSITVTEGVYKLFYRSTDRMENVESDKELTLKVDMTAPAYRLTANGTELAEGTVFEDDVWITLALTSEDRLSGVAVQTMALDGQVLSNGSTIELAGKPGLHTLNLSVTDLAGNTTQAVIRFEVAASIRSLKQLMARYEASGDLKGPLVEQLRTSLDQAEHHLNKGAADQAVHHMEKFMQQLQNPPMQDHVSQAVHDILAADAEALIGTWTSR